jgi:hypothetical protein
MTIPVLEKQERSESNAQPPVLETGALPIELRSFAKLPKIKALASRLKAKDGNQKQSRWIRENQMMSNKMAQPAPAILFFPRFLMECMFAFFTAIFLEPQAICATRFLGSPVIAVAAGRAFQPYIFTH